MIRIAYTSEYNNGTLCFDRTKYQYYKERVYTLSYKDIFIFFHREYISKQITLHKMKKKNTQYDARTQV